MKKGLYPPNNKRIFKQCAFERFTRNNEVDCRRIDRLWQSAWINDCRGSCCCGYEIEVQDFLETKAIISNL